eukprot:316521-Rhodomonas_salina.1
MPVSPRTAYRHGKGRERSEPSPTFQKRGTRDRPRVSDRAPRTAQRLRHRGEHTRPTGMFESLPEPLCDRLRRGGTPGPTAALRCAPAVLP